MNSATHAPSWPELQPLYRAGVRPRLVEVPRLRVLAITGRSEPGGAPFQAAFEALMSVSFSVKFLLARQIGLSWKVPPPEGQFWTAADVPLDRALPDQWHWRLFVVQPEALDETTLRDAIAHTRETRGSSPWWERLQLDRLDEGTSAQILHVGPHEEERPTIEKLQAYIEAQSLEPAGAHHEIYLGDPRRSDPSRIKTILRQPVRPRRRRRRSS